MSNVLATGKKHGTARHQAADDILGQETCLACKVVGPSSCWREGIGSRSHRGCQLSLVTRCEGWWASHAFTCTSDPALSHKIRQSDVAGLAQIGLRADMAAEQREEQDVVVSTLGLKRQTALS